MQNFFESLIGQFVVCAIMAGALATIFALSPKPELSSQNRTRTMSVSALLVALAFILNNYVVIYHLPNGGSVTAGSMLVLFLAGYLFGPKIGILAAACYGLLDLLVNPYVIHPIQLLLDYPLGFGMLGVGSLLRKGKNGLIAGYLLAVTGRFVASFLSGVIFFGAYAPEGTSVFVYSAGYNISYIGPEAALTVIILLVPSVRKALEMLVRRYGESMAGAGKEFA